MENSPEQSSPSGSSLTSSLLEPFLDTNDSTTAKKTWGAAATLGISMAVLGFVYRARGKGRDAGAAPNGSGLLSFLRALLRILLRRSLKSWGGIAMDEEKEGDAYFLVAHGRAEKNEEQEEGRVMAHKGSCHCRAIRFVLNGKRNLEALDSPGKIRYPRILTTASQFQLTSGTQLLAVYYVNLPTNTPTPGNISITAAHAFCKRCGVPILWAPDSKQNALEVNANCLDMSVEHNVSISFCQDKKSLGAGVPVKNQWNATQNDKQQQSLSPTTIKPTKQVLEECQPNILAYPHYPSTPTTASTSSQTSLGLDQESSSIESSSSGGSVSMGIGNWAVGSSLRSFNVEDKTTAIDSSILRDQLKYHMRRHLTSSSSSSMGLD